MSSDHLAFMADSSVGNCFANCLVGITFRWNAHRHVCRYLTKDFLLTISKIYVLSRLLKIGMRRDIATKETRK